MVWIHHSKVQAVCADKQQGEFCSAAAPLPQTVALEMQGGLCLLRSPGTANTIEQTAATVCTVAIYSCLLH